MGVVLRFIRAVFTVFGATLLSAALLAAPASAETQRVPLWVDVSAQSRVVGTTVGTLDSTCPDLEGCGWSGSDFTGTRYQVPNTAGQYPPTYHDIRSAKNRFNQRALGFYDYTNGQRIRCLNAGASFPGPFPANARIIVVGPPNSIC